MLCSFHLTLLSFNIKLILSAGIRGLLLWTGTPSNFDVIGHVNSFEFLLLSVNLLFINNWQMHSFFSEYQPGLFMCGVIGNIPFFLQMSLQQFWLWAKTLWSVVATDMGLVASAHCLCWPLLFGGSLLCPDVHSSLITWVTWHAVSRHAESQRGPWHHVRSESEGGTRSEGVINMLDERGKLII